MTPSTKVTAATAAAALTTLLLFIAQSQGWIGDVPAALEVAITTLLTLAAGYFIRERNPSPSTIEAVKNAG